MPILPNDLETEFSLMKEAFNQTGITEDNLKHHDVRDANCAILIPFPTFINSFLFRNLKERSLRECQN